MEGANGSSNREGKGVAQGVSGRHMTRRRLYLAVVKPRKLYGADVFIGSGSEVIRSKKEAV